jgi:dTDP-4-dehydrorhamnose reductase
MIGRVRVALFGASGLLGWTINQGLKLRGFQAIPYRLHDDKYSDVESFRFLDLDDTSKVTRELLDLWPDAIINCAAISSPDLVNQDPKAAERINVYSAQKLAEISTHLGARFIHISSDMVFSGRNEPYRSTDTPGPLNEYGNQKLESEKKVLFAADENVVVLRLTLINGNSPRANRSPHERILESIQKGMPITLFDDEYRQPCSADNVASVVVELLERPNLNGLFHWAGKDVLTRFELGLRILERFGLSTNLIKRGSLKDSFIEVGKRPSRLTFELSPLLGKIKTKPQGVEEQLEGLEVPKRLYKWYRDNAEDPSKYVLRL